MVLVLLRGKDGFEIQRKSITSWKALDNENKKEPIMDMILLQQ